MNPQEIVESAVPVARKRYHDSRVGFLASVAQNSSPLPQAAVSTRAVICRFAALRRLNDNICVLSPFCDVAGAAFGKVRVESKNSSQQRPSSLSSASGSALSHLRGLMFLSTKRAIISTMLRRTVTQAKKAEDDYGYPEDLTQVVLNRPK